MKRVAELARSAWEGLPMRGGLGRRILLWFLVLSLLPLFLSNTLGYLVSRRILEGQIRRYLVALTEVEAQHVAGEVERHQLYLQAVTAGNTFLARSVPAVAAALQAGRRQDPVVTRLHEHIDRKLAELRTLTDLFVLDQTGRVIAATRHDQLEADWSSQHLYQVGRSSAFFAEGWTTDHAASEPYYQLAVPILDGSGHSVGVLAATVDLDRVKSFLRIPPHLAGDVHSYIVDAAGRPLVISHPHLPIDHGESLPSPLAQAPTGTVTRYVNYEGVEVIGTAVPIPNGTWRYIAEVPVSSAFGELRSLALLAGVLEAAFALVLVALVWLVARSIVAPLRRLVGAAERIRAGELGVEVQIDREDELGDLGRTFNQMSSELQTSARRIQELHDQEMRRAAQLASVGELASGIAHEIKNPLVGAASGLDLLSRRLDADPKGQGIAEQVRSQLHRIESALHDLLSYARPKEPRLAWTAPEQLLDHVATLVRPQAEAAGVQIDRRISGPLPKIHVDPEQLTQALVNLALNGVQAMGPGGVLTLEVEQVNEAVRISISDTGGGIRDDAIEMIFRPFYTTKHRGTGLGLAITRGIVERHGGRLDVETEPGEGSTFTLTFTTRRTEPETP